MERIRLVAIDLDGTLLDDRHRIPRANAEAIARCRAAGVGVMLASGRTWASVGPYCRELGLAGPQIILNGGAIVEAPGGEIEPGPTLPEEVLRAIAGGLQARGLRFVVFGTRSIYALPGTPEAAELQEFGEPPAVIVPGLDRGHLPDPVKVLAFTPADASGDAGLVALAEGLADTVRTHGRFFEFVPPGMTKGQALATVMGRRGVPREAVLAIGDYYNDLSMFAEAGVSVAMGNAPDEVRARADDVTATCDEDGLARALERHVLDPVGRPPTGKAR